MEISLVLSDTCGYHEETKEILKQAMEEAGVEADVAVTVIHQDEEAITETVSYTHLTLPTILRE